MALVDFARNHYLRMREPCSAHSQMTTNYVCYGASRYRAASLIKNAWGPPSDDEINSWYLLMFLWFEWITVNFKSLIDFFRLNVIQSIINNKVKHFEKKITYTCKKIVFVGKDQEYKVVYIGRHIFFYMNNKMKSLDGFRRKILYFKYKYSRCNNGTQ